MELTYLTSHLCGFCQLTVSSANATMLYHPRMVAALNHTWLNGTGGDTWTTSEDQDPPEPPDVGVVEAAVAAALDPENIRDIDQILGEGDPFRQGLFW